MKKEQLKIGDYLQSDSGKFAYVDKILPSKVRVFIDDQKDYILDNQLHKQDTIESVDDIPKSKL